MHGFDDTTKDLDERASERMNFRIKPHVKRAIQRAAALSGVDDSVYTMSAAYSSALATIAAHERTTIAPVDNEALFSALDAPPEPTPDLHKAFASHRARVTSE